MDAVNNISSPLESLQGLAKKVESIDNKLNQFKTIALTAMALLALVVTSSFCSYNLGHDLSASGNVSTLSRQLEKDSSPNVRNSSMANPRAGVGRGGPVRNEAGTNVSP